MKVAIHSRTFSPERIPCFHAVIDALLQREAQVTISVPLAAYLQEISPLQPSVQIFSQPEELEGVDYMFSVGGDGTLLETVTLVKHRKIPIVGINTGRLGFLATISDDKINFAVDSIMAGRFRLEQRILVEVNTSTNIFNGLNFGLNEFAITKRDSSSMIVVHTYIDGEYLNSYWADGLIVATPTGSTGYSLSVGGPVVNPSLNNIFIISPVSPHNLTVRPLIVPADCELTFKIEGRSQHCMVSLDSRSVAIDQNLSLSVRKCRFEVALVKLEGYSFADTLRKKLNWGYDLRN